MQRGEMTAVLAREPGGAGRDQVNRHSDASSTAGQVLAFAGAFGLVLVYALRGGSYDIVAFEEYGLLVWWLLAIGLGVGLLPRMRPAPMVLVLCGALLAYAAWTALSLIWTQSGELTTKEIARSLDYLGIVLLLGLVLGRETWRAAAAGLAFGALTVCVIAVASRLDLAAFPADVVALTFKTDRLSFPFGYWNAVAAWGAMAIAIGLAWSAHDRTPLRRALALALVPAAGLATYLTYSRAGALGTALGVILVLALSENRLTALLHGVVASAGAAATILAVRAEPQIAHATGDHGALTVWIVLLGATILAFSVAWLTGAAGVDRWRVPRRAARPILVACSVAAVAAAAVLGPKLVRSGWHSFTRQAVVVKSGDPAARLLTLSGTRYEVWKSALKGFAAHPLDGMGAGTFEFWFNQHPEGDAAFLRDAHDLWLQNMAELGVPGLLLILAVAVAATGVAFEVRRKARRQTSVGVSTAFLAAFVVFLFHASVDWMWESTAVTVLALAGVGAVGARFAQPGLSLRWWARVACVALCVAAGALQLPGLLSTNDIRSSQAAERARNGHRALALANDAVDIEPWSASAYEQRGLVLEAARRYRAATVALRRALSDEPTNYVHWLDLAVLETEEGKIHAALAAYAQAHRLRPDSLAFVTPVPGRLR